MEVLLVANDKNMSDAEMEKASLSTGEQLSKQPKKTITLHLEPEKKLELQRLVETGDKNIQWPCEVVSINGYIYTIKRGVEVEIPMTVWEVLMNAGMI
jgi:hypothetical protein